MSPESRGETHLETHRMNFARTLEPQYGYDLPKLHHQRSTYVTRRKKGVEEEE